MRAIILAAGHSYSMDGIVKCLIKNPKTGKSILGHAVEALQGYDITVVVGYKAVEIMQEFPQLDYVYNSEWSITSNSYSLGLVLDTTPSFVLSSDLLFDRSFIEEMDKLDNAVLVEERENRTLSAIHCVVDGARRIVESYVGPLRSAKHPEAIGIYKISSPELLRAWKKNCLEYSNIFVGQNLPLAPDNVPIIAHHKQSGFFAEVNTPNDYLALIRQGGL